MERWLVFYKHLAKVVINMLLLTDAAQNLCFVLLTLPNFNSARLHVFIHWII